jgi:hypothetical protein
VAAHAGDCWSALLCCPTWLDALQQMTAMDEERNLSRHSSPPSGASGHTCPDDVTAAAQAKQNRTQSRFGRAARHLTRALLSARAPTGNVLPEFFSFLKNFQILGDFLPL